jgi:hypothetical protein
VTGHAGPARKRKLCVGGRAMLRLGTRGNGSSSLTYLFVRLAFRGALLLEDEIHKLLTEVRAGTDVVGPDINLVQVLESEDVTAAQLGYDAAEEKAKFI